LTPVATPRRNIGGAPRRNMTRVRPRILLGNDLAARSRELLHAHNVSHVLNCGRTAEHFRGDPDSPVYLSLGLRDDVAINGDELHEQLLRAVSFIGEFLNEGAETSVLVHCREGISRSCGVMLAYLMVTEDLELGAAMEELRALHQKCDPNLGILMALQDWAEWYRAAVAQGRAKQAPSAQQAQSAQQAPSAPTAHSDHPNEGAEPMAM
jgi:protein-tyrosine phosphatase